MKSVRITAVVTTGLRLASLVLLSSVLVPADAQSEALADPTTELQEAAVSTGGVECQQPQVYAG